MPDYLFSSEELGEFLHQRTRDAANLVAGFGAEEILQKPAEDLADIIVASCTINLPVLDRERQVLNEPVEIFQEVNDYGRRIRVPGLSLTLTIPFTGEGRYFRFRPSSFTLAAYDRVIGVATIASPKSVTRRARGVLFVTYHLRTNRPFRES